jgi:hypothetical protein
MMSIIAVLQKDLFTPRFYVAALTDSMSLQKAHVYEQSLIQVAIYHHVLICLNFAKIFGAWF